MSFRWCNVITYVCTIFCMKIKFVYNGIFVWLVFGVKWKHAKWHRLKFQNDIKMLIIHFNVCLLAFDWSFTVTFTLLTLSLSLSLSLYLFFPIMEIKTIMETIYEYCYYGIFPTHAYVFIFNRGLKRQNIVIKWKGVV